MRLQIVAPSGFAGRVIAAYRDGVAARDLVFLVFGVRREAWGAERLYVLKVVLDVKSRGEHVPASHTAYMLEEASRVGLDLIGMIHFHGWPGGCGYLSTTDKNTLKNWGPRFVAFVAAPDCLKAWRMKDGQVEEVPIAEVPTYAVADPEQRSEEELAPPTPTTERPSAEDINDVKRLLAELVKLNEQYREVLWATIAHLYTIEKSCKKARSNFLTSIFTRRRHVTKL
jgi:proteasome lid subunit RPN8/RPN11